MGLNSEIAWKKHRCDILPGLFLLDATKWLYQLQRLLQDLCPLTGLSFTRSPALRWFLWAPFGRFPERLELSSLLEVDQRGLARFWVRRVERDSGRKRLSPGAPVLAHLQPSFFFPWACFASNRRVACKKGFEPPSDFDEGSGEEAWSLTCSCRPQTSGEVSGEANPSPFRSPRIIFPKAKACVSKVPEASLCTMPKLVHGTIPLCASIKILKTTRVTTIYCHPPVRS